MKVFFYRSDWPTTFIKYSRYDYMPLAVSFA
jgi:hypothetical protein